MIIGVGGCGKLFVNPHVSEDTGMKYGYLETKRCDAYYICKSASHTQSIITELQRI